MELCTAIEQWDGKCKNVIAKIFQEFASTESFSQQLIELISETRYEQGASWLLKAWCEQNGKLSAQQSQLLVGRLPFIEHWQCKLHILQIFEYLVFAEADERIPYAFVRRCLQDTNKFVRAWAYHGFFFLAVQFSSYQPEVMECLEMALNDEPPSVKARVRRLLKVGFP